MSIMTKLFGPTATTVNAEQNPGQQQQATTVATQPGNLPSDAGATDSKNPQTPPGTVDNSNKPKENDSPLAQFESLWEPVTDEKGKPIEEQPAVPQFNEEDIRKVVEKGNFAASITADDLTAITGGGDEAVTTFAKVLNQVAVQAVTTSLMAGNKMTEQAVTSAIQATENKIPSLVRNQSVSSHMRDENPIFKNPAVQPVIDAVSTQLQTKFPDATPADIKKMAQDYVVEIGKAVAPADTTTKDEQTGETDWMKWATT